jgi:transcriptional regulator with XRE-family HTH domain
MAKPMSTKAFAALLAQLGETQEQQAELLGCGRRSLIRYLQGTPVPATVRRLAILLVKHGPPKHDPRY